MHRRMNVPLAINLQDQLISGSLDQSEDLFPRSRHDVRRIDEDNVITWSETGSFRRTGRVHAFHAGWSSPGQRETPWNLGQQENFSSDFHVREGRILFIDAMFFPREGTGSSLLQPGGSLMSLTTVAFNTTTRAG